MKIKYIYATIIMVLALFLWQANAIDYDNDKVINARLSWNNELREDMWLVPYKLDSRLEDTAIEWSEYQNSIWTWTHKRRKTDGFYTYKSVEKWFSDRWIKFDNINRITFTENVWVWYVSCKQKDCTDEVISAIKTTWKFYLSEKKAGWAHRNSLINKNFRYVWIGIVVNSKNKYYLTIHYGTKITSKTENTYDNNTKVTEKYIWNEELNTWELWSTWITTWVIATWVITSWINNMFDIDRNNGFIK